ncbi:hypothetical protein [Clostridium sp. C8-1-8]|jgi:hypothetical protein|uniref:hypothetical protein n=1 Tax=Clostridium sp. C8-1-8 TaxID=2698831 RepID=UPI001370EB2E|nr:hypothetical protein [Clostridium sp. C8-1-8]
MDEKWKKRALALSVATAVSLASPLYNEGKLIVKATPNSLTEEEEQQAVDQFEKDDAYHGTGSSGIIFPSSVPIMLRGKATKFSSDSWKAWQDGKGLYGYKHDRMTSSSS